MTTSENRTWEPAPAGAVLGGIPLLFQAERERPAATDPHRGPFMHRTKWLFMVSFLAALLVGCSKQSGFTLPGPKSSGNLVPFVMRCATARGAYATTNLLPVINVEWMYMWKENVDTIVMAGDHFSEIQKFLEQAYGVPDTHLGSSAAAPIRASRFLGYSPQQIGVRLGLTANKYSTHVQVITEPAVIPKFRL
jgi:hypothetical protein